MFESLQFREVLSQFPTGVTVITADTPSGPSGIAANSFTSVSLEPPLVLFCPAKASTTWPNIRDSGRHCVNILAGHQEALCLQFARRGTDRFLGVSLRTRVGGPALDEAAAWLDCELETEYDAGDHTIAVSRVVSVEVAPDAVPLLFHRGRYGALR